MANSRQLIVTLVSDSKNFSKGFKEAQGDVGKFEKNMKGAQGETSKFGKRVDVLRTSVGKLGAAMAGAFVASKVVDFARDSIRAASDLNESMNAVNVTFGEAAGGIEALANESATSLGLAKSEFNGLAVSVSAFAESIAGAGGDVVGVVDKLTTRAADFASVMNLDVNDAMEKFRSGLAGETEPLRRFGIDLSAASVQSFALANGIIETRREMTEAEKVQARYGSLMEQTAKTAGDFANTSDNLANAQRIAKAEFEDARAEIGERLLPVMVELTETVRDQLPALTELGVALADVAGYAIEIAGAVGEAGNQFYDSETGVVRWRTALFYGIPVLEDLAQKFDAVVVSEETLRQSMEENKDTMTRAITGYGQLGDTVGSADDAMLNMAKRGAAEIVSAMEQVPPVINNIAGPLDGLIADLLATAEAAENVFGVLKSASDPVFAAVDAWKSYQDAVAAATEDGTVTAQEELDLLSEKVDLRAALGELGSNYEEAMNALALATDTPIEKVEELFETLGLIDGKTFTTTVQTQFTTSGNPNPTNTGIEFRASGGPVTAGSPYVVGEQGPELFVPGRSGMIHPNSALTGGAGGVTVNVNNPQTLSLDRDIQRGLLLSGISRWAEVN